MRPLPSCWGRSRIPANRSLPCPPAFALCTTLAWLAGLLPAACSSGNDAIDPGGRAFDAVAPEEIVTLAGTEPFWNVRIAYGEAVWMTPENPGGTRFAVNRFAGNNGLGIFREISMAGLFAATLYARRLQ